MANRCCVGKSHSARSIHHSGKTTPVNFRVGSFFTFQDVFRTNFFNFSGLKLVAFSVFGFEHDHFFRSQHYFSTVCFSVFEGDGARGNFLRLKLYAKKENQEENVF